MAGLAYYTRQEVSLHDSKDDCWIIVHGKVYDVTKWLVKHPGGKSIILHRAGEDATVAFETFHTKSTCQNYLKQFCIGELVSSEKALSSIEQDFLELKNKLTQKGLFEPTLSYFVAHLLAGVLLEGIAIALLWTINDSWLAWSGGVFLAAISASVMQGLGHDLGHCCVFKNSPATNYLAQNFCYTFLGGVSSLQWNSRHQRHHAKPNVQTKDPDVSYSPYIYLIGSDYPKKLGRKRQGILPYQYQGTYLPLIGFTIVYLVWNVESIYILYKNYRKKWKDILWLAAFCLRWYLIYSCLCGNGFWSGVGFFVAVKGFLGLWLSFAVQTHHTSRPISTEDPKQDWLTLQVEHTHNSKYNWFVDIFTFHTSYQIEHHLFPSMPPHNHYLAQPYVKELCSKYNLQYHERTLWEALTDIPREFNKCGREWYHEYTKATAALKNKGH